MLFWLTITTTFNPLPPAWTDTAEKMSASKENKASLPEAPNNVLAIAANFAPNGQRVKSHPKDSPNFSLFLPPKSRDPTRP